MNKPYNDIEEWSKLAAQKRIIPFDEDAWKKMEALLEEEDRNPTVIIKPNKFIFRKRYTLLLLAALLLGGGFWLISTSKKSITTANTVAVKEEKNMVTTNAIPALQNEQETKDAIAETAVPLPDDKKVIAAIAPPKNNIIGNGGGDKKNQSVLINHASLNNQATPKIFIPVTPSKSIAATVIDKTTFIKQKVKKKLLKEILPSEKLEKEAITEEDNMTTKSLVKNKKDKVRQTNTEESAAIADKDILARKDTSRLTTDKKIIAAVPKPETPMIPTIKETAKEEKKEPIKVQAPKKKLLSHFAFSAITTPEFNTVRFKEKNNPTVGYGLELNYSLGNHFVASAGYFRGKKNYSTDRNGYIPPDGSVLTYVDTLNIYAQCKIIDIPIRVRYSFMGNANNSFFLSAGLSSYIMKQEKYDFKYFRQGMYIERQRTIDNQNDHLFSSLNLSFGYQHWYNKKWMLSISPYIKVPLKGIGIGKVNLTSVGTFIGVSYKPWQ
jgi:hypothetical protein